MGKANIQDLLRGGLKGVWWVVVCALCAGPCGSMSREIDYKETVERAKQGDLEAQFDLGEVMRIVEKDVPEACRWYEKAAEQGHLQAQFLLGLLLGEGEGVQRDFLGAHTWFERAASNPKGQDSEARARALYCLGVFYRDGSGVEPNLEKARCYFERAAELKLLEAQIMLGDIYYCHTLLKDLDKAYVWYEKAAAQGSEAVDLELARIAHEKKWYEKARHWYEKASRKASGEANCLLGVYYAEGIGVEKDRDKAMAYFHLSAESGFPSAYCCLGGIYSGQKGGVEELEKAHGYYEKAAEMGHLKAQVHVARNYLYGRGVDQSLLSAISWLKIAAASGSREAKELLEKILDWLRQSRTEEQDNVKVQLQRAEGCFKVGHVEQGAVLLEEVLASQAEEGSSQTLQERIENDLEEEQEATLTQWVAHSKKPENFPLNTMRLAALHFGRHYQIEPLFAPVIGEDKVYVVAENQTLYCLDQLTGDVVWKEANVATPPRLNRQEQLCFCLSKEKVTSMTSDGKVLASYAEKRQGLSAPAIDCSGQVYFASAFGRRYDMHKTTASKQIFSPFSRKVMFPVCHATGKVDWIVISEGNVQCFRGDETRPFAAYQLEGNHVLDPRSVVVTSQGDVVIRINANTLCYMTPKKVFCRRYDLVLGVPLTVDIEDHIYCFGRDNQSGTSKIYCVDALGRIQWEQCVGTPIKDMSQAGASEVISWLLEDGTVMWTTRLNRLPQKEQRKT